jgi:uncharacterized damage-inducible protein DinB
VTVERIDPPFISDERASLRAWLEFHRATLLWKCDGLDEAGLKARPLATSMMSLHGLVRHLAEVERNWFRIVLAGEDIDWLYGDDDHPDGDFELTAEADWTVDVAAWMSECEHSRRLEEAAPSLDVTGLRHEQPVDLRWIMVHMIEEYARHNGHADVIRELVDGTVGD